MPLLKEFDLSLTVKVQKKDNYVSVYSYDFAPSHGENSFHSSCKGFLVNPLSSGSEKKKLAKCITETIFDILQERQKYCEGENLYIGNVIFATPQVKYVKSLKGAKFKK